MVKCSSGIPIVQSESFYLPAFNQTQTEWIMFDVGQGLAMAFIYQQNKAVIYDTGSSWQANDILQFNGKMEILPFKAKWH